MQDSLSIWNLLNEIDTLFPKILDLWNSQSDRVNLADNDLQSTEEKQSIELELSKDYNILKEASESLSLADTIFIDNIKQGFAKKEQKINSWNDHREPEKPDPKEIDLISDSSEAFISPELHLSLLDKWKVDKDQSNLTHSKGPYANPSYWTMPSYDSLTPKPLFVDTHQFNQKAGTAKKVSLLAEAEAFVRLYGLNNQKINDLYQIAPRHLLVHISQVVTRAWFDPGYRQSLFNFNGQLPSFHY